MHNKPANPAREAALESALSRIRHAAQHIGAGRVIAIIDRERDDQTGEPETTGCWIRAVSTEPEVIERTMKEPPGRGMR